LGSSGCCGYVVSFLFVYCRKGADVGSMVFATAPENETMDAAVRHAEAYVAMCQEDQGEDERALFPNHTRVGKVEERYRGVERRQRLRGLKEVWDPEGVFTKQFL